MTRIDEVICKWCDEMWEIDSCRHKDKNSATYISCKWKKQFKQSIREVMLKTYKEAHKKREQGFSSLSEFFREFLDCLFGEK